MSSTAAGALGRLMADIGSGSGNEVLSASLAAVVRTCLARELDVRYVDGALMVDGAVVPHADEPALRALAEGLERHQLRGIHIQMSVPPREVLQLAALLAGAQAAPDESSIRETARALGFWHVELRGGRDIVMTSGIHPVVTPQTMGAHAALPPVASFSSVDDAQTQCNALVSALDAALALEDAIAVAQVLSTARRTERAVASSDHPEAAALASIVSECLGRLTVPHALRLTAGLVLDDTFPRDELREILRRAGDAGTLALFQHLSASGSMVQRRLLFDTIVTCGTGVPVLIAHLAHERWFVARNAACLLGAMRASDAEAALTQALSHDDERVRVAAATALLQMGTASGHRALERAIHDSSSGVRRHALRALLRGDALVRSATILSEALDLERDADVQLDVVASLRQLATPQAVQQLVRLCGMTGQIARAPAVRRAALEALVDLRPAVAAPLLRRFVQDRDADTRAHAQHLLTRTSSVA